MSRIGKKPVAVPSGVSVQASGKQLRVKGPKGELELTVRPEIEVKLEGSQVLVERTGDESDRQVRAFHGLTRALVQNMVTGVSVGYEKKLEINGVGYTAKVEGANLVFTLGYANPVHRAIPKTLNVTCPNPTTVLIKGCDKQQVGEFAAKIRALKKPEPYKGKGIKYDTEVIRRKAGKAFSSA